MTDPWRCCFIPNGPPWEPWVTGDTFTCAMRKNKYEANITVEPVNGAWKITDLELLEEKRIDPNAKPKN